MTRKLRLAALAVLAGCLWTGQAGAAVRLARVFSDNAVLQRDLPVPIWGWASPGDKVTVRFAGQAKTGTANEDGKWRVKLDPLPVNKTGATLVVACGDEQVTRNNLLVGEVWVCSGQSNMEMTVGGCLNFNNERTEADKYPLIRHIKVPNVDSGRPVEDLPGGNWTVCGANSVAGFTAAGYFFAREVVKALDVPVGLIGSNWGGTAIEPWTCYEGFTQVPELKRYADQVEPWLTTTAKGQANYLDFLAKLKAWLPGAQAAAEAKRPIPPMPVEPCAPGNAGQVTRLYNGLIAPIVGYGIRGALWYQGEANGGEGVSYYQKMHALVQGWRTVWGQGEFPFYWVQLANFQRSNPDAPSMGDGWAKVREAQAQAQDLPSSGMACIIDIGDGPDIHPKDKQDVGKRLALWALAKTYGQAGTVCSGPLYKSMAIEGAKVRVSFDSLGGGLVVGEKHLLDPFKETPGAKVKWLSLQGKDGTWQWADGVVEGNTLVVSSDKVKEPVAVRYAYTMNPEGCNLYNKEGLPVVPFRTDK